MIQLRLNSNIKRSIGVILVLASLLAANISVAECLPGQMQEANLAYRSAEEFLAAKQWDQAIARLESIVGVCPEHVDATRGIATAFFSKKNYPQAIEWYNKVVALRANSVEAGDFANLGRCYAQLKKYKESRAQYMKAQQLAPNDCGVLYNLGVMHYASKFHAQAVEVLEHALVTCPQYKANILPNLIKAATAASAQQKRNGNTAKASEFAALAQKYGSESGGSDAMDIIRTKMKAKDYTGAVVMLKSSLEKNQNQPNAWLTLGRAADAAGQGATSIEAYQKYLSFKSNDTDAIAAMLQVMVENGQCTKAATAAATGVARNQGKGRTALGPIYYSWGLALECQEDYALAKEKFQKCASSGHARYASSGATQVERMDGFLAQQAAKDRKKNR